MMLLVHQKLKFEHHGTKPLDSQLFGVVQHLTLQQGHLDRSGRRQQAAGERDAPPRQRHAPALFARRQGARVLVRTHQRRTRRVVCVPRQVAGNTLALRTGTALEGRQRSGEEAQAAGQEGGAKTRRCASAAGGHARMGPRRCLPARAPHHQRAWQREQSRTAAVGRSHPDLDQ